MTAEENLEIGKPLDFSINEKHSFQEWLQISRIQPIERAIEIVKKINQVFPSSEEMVLKKSLREDKYVAAQMNLYNPILEEIIYAFQDKRIVKLIGEICILNDLFPDENLLIPNVIDPAIQLKQIFQSDILTHCL